MKKKNNNKKISCSNNLISNYCYQDSSNTAVIIEIFPGSGARDPGVPPGSPWQPLEVSASVGIAALAPFVTSQPQRQYEKPGI